MTQARQELISLSDTSYYHCINRCVRRAFLCGEDHLTGDNYEHRKAWVMERLTLLSQVFAIEVASYAIMSNHYHLVVRIDQQQTEHWSDEELMGRWSQLYNLPPLIARYQSGEDLGSGELREIHKTLDLYRERLGNISWFMRGLNEYLARKANREDECTGRFWEGRFKSQALLDDAAVLTCMSYVDLNPIRAQIADTPEASDYTSIKQRIQEQLHNIPDAEQACAERLRLMPLIPIKQDKHPHAIGFSLEDYLQLVDWACRHIVAGKRGAIDDSIPPVLHRLGLCPDGYMDHVRARPMNPKPRVIGHETKIRSLAEQLQQTFLKGLDQARKLYLSPA